MHNYKIGDRVIVEKSNVDHIYGSQKGKTGTIMSVMDKRYPYLVKMDFDCSRIWCEVAGYIENKMEEKKVFTKKDLKSGMFGYFDNETDDYFVVAGDRFIYQGGLGDDVSKLNDNLEMPSGRKITALYKGISFNQVKSGSATLIWKRKEKPKSKPLYNGKVVCIDLNGGNGGLYTVGKIYQFQDGVLTADDGYKFTNCLDKPFSSFEEWSKFSGSKWLEVKE